MNRWPHLPGMFALLLSSVAALAAEAPPFKESARSSQFSPEYRSTHVVDGRLIFSQYGKSGNAFDILSLDPTTLAPQVLIEERKGGRFIAKDDRFLVIQQEGDVANPLIVLDAASHQELGRVRLKQQIAWGRIQGDRLLLIQGAGSSSGYLETAPALIYSLPTLQLLRSTTITGGNDQQSWGNHIVSLGREVAVYDDQFERVGATVTFPLVRSKGNVSCAAKGPLLIAQDKAVVVANCGEIYIVNLKTRSLEAAIAAFSHFYSAQIIDSILFVGVTDGEQSKDIHAFDLTSGELLAVLPIDASRGLSAIGPQLLAMSSRREGYRDKVTITSFTIDNASLRQGKWRLTQVIDTCRQGERIVAESDDIYRAIDLCRSAGIEGFVGAKNLSADIRSLVRSYATWRSRTFDQSREATQILEWLVASGTPKEEVSAALLEASARRKMMANAALTFPMTASEIEKALARDLKGVQDLDERELKTEIGRVIVKNSTALSARKVTLDSSVPDVIDPDGKFVYGSRYDCSRECSDTGPAVVIYDRESLSELAAISVVPFDDDFQDGIDSIAVDAQHIYVSIVYRWEPEDRTNFVIIDKATRQITKRVHLATGAASLKIENGELLSCDCRQSTCHVIDTQSFETQQRIFQECSDSTSVVTSNEYQASRIASPSARWMFVRSTDGHKTEFEFKQIVGTPILPEQAHAAIFLSLQQYARSIVLGDLRTGTLRTLLTLPQLSGLVAGPRLIVSGSTLFVSYGRDLMLLDLKTLKIRKYFPDFITGGFNNNGNDVDRNQITEMHIDGDRLILKTFDGLGTAVVKLPDLLR